MNTTVGRISYYGMEQNANGLDWAEGQALTGCSDLQVAFCQHLLEGKSKTAAARDAGYGGEGVALRAAASRAAQSHKVRALIAWAKAGGAGLSEVPGDVDELKRILWRHARSADPNRSIRGVEALTKLENAEREAQERASEHVHPPGEILAAIARKSPLVAALSALHENLFWEVPVADMPKIFEEFARLRASLEGGQGSVSQADAGSNGAALQASDGATVSATGLTFDSETQTWRGDGRDGQKL